MLIRSDADLVRALAAHPEARVYAFDLFDTLIARLLPPEYVKFLACVALRRRRFADRTDLDRKSVV